MLAASFCIVDSALGCKLDTFQLGSGVYRDMDCGTDSWVDSHLSKCDGATDSSTWGPGLWVFTELSLGTCHKNFPFPFLMAHTVVSTSEAAVPLVTCNSI